MGWELGRPSPSSTMQVEGLGERRELPQRGLGQSPGRQRIFGILIAHRTLLVERTVLLYHIKQALRHNKASIFVKKSTQSKIGEPRPSLPPSGYAPARVLIFYRPRSAAHNLAHIGGSADSSTPHFRQCPLLLHRYTDQRVRNLASVLGHIHL